MTADVTLLWIIKTNTRCWKDETGTMVCWRKCWHIDSTKGKSSWWLGNKICCNGFGNSYYCLQVCHILRIHYIILFLVLQCIWRLYLNVWIYARHQARGKYIKKWKIEPCDLRESIQPWDRNISYRKICMSAFTYCCGFGSNRFYRWSFQCAWVYQRWVNEYVC